MSSYPTMTGAMAVLGSHAPSGPLECEPVNPAPPVTGILTS